MTYYIDESGNTGDLIISANNKNFSNQEYFSLACIGIEDNQISEFEKKVSDLKTKYKIQSEELKSTSIYNKKISFIDEVIDYLENINANVLIELVDKKYIIAINIVNCLIHPQYFTKHNTETQQLMIIITSYLYNYLPTSFYIEFSNTARNPSQEGLEMLFSNLEKCLKDLNSDMSLAIISHLQESYDDYKIMKKQDKIDRPAYTYFLPLSDKNKRNQLIGILPHISSFTNIHARLNLIHDNDLVKHEIIHDNQDHFDEIIKYYHESSVKNTVDENHYINPNSNFNFNFTEHTKLKFEDSKQSLGIQIADLFAGLSAKVAHSIISDNTKLKNTDFDIALNILNKVQLFNNKKLGLGVNIVAAENIQKKIFIRLLTG